MSQATLLVLTLLALLAIVMSTVMSRQEAASNLGRAVHIWRLGSLE